MKRSDKIKVRKRIENGCNFPHLMKVAKYPSGTFSTYSFPGYYVF